MAKNNRKHFFEFTGTQLLEARSFKRPLLDFEFTDGQVQVKEREDKTVEHIAPYLPSKDAVQVIKLAQILHRPILLRGEPGCGKTRLAEAYAYERYGADYRKHYFEWFIKSTSKAADGLYTFDHLRRLRDANLQDGNANIEEVAAYRELGPVGKAIALSTKEHPSILLIDEIDKADIDFPNDLLLELDEKRFFVKETKEEFRAGYPPVIFITSNNEKELPPAFLRRCLYLYIDFPSSDILMEIIQARFNDPEFLQQQEVLDMIIKEFIQLRTEITAEPTLSKQVSTSELLDWVGVIYFYFKEHREEFDQLELAKRPFSQTLLKGYDQLTSNLTSRA